MSFEGYYQIICKKGHYFEKDVYAATFIEDEEKCPYCKAKMAWWNMVDVTNGSFNEKGRRIDGFLKLKIASPAKTKKCNECGHEKIIEQVTYKIPDKKGHKVKLIIRKSARRK